MHQALVPVPFNAARTLSVRQVFIATAKETSILYISELLLHFTQELLPHRLSTRRLVLQTTRRKASESTSPITPVSTHICCPGKCTAYLKTAPPPNNISLNVGEHENLRVQSCVNFAMLKVTRNIFFPVNTKHIERDVLPLSSAGYLR